MLFSQRQALSRGESPEAIPGGQCLASYECVFFTACNPPLPENYISTLSNLSTKKNRDAVGRKDLVDPRHSGGLCAFRISAESHCQNRTTLVQ
jgi:hypothetical protein